MLTGNRCHRATGRISRASRPSTISSGASSAASLPCPPAPVVARWRRDRRATSRYRHRRASSSCRMCISLQAGDDMILKRMRQRLQSRAGRRPRRALHARASGRSAIGADIIAGPDRRTRRCSEASLKLVRDGRIVRGHVFPYSPRTGARPPRMPRRSIAALWSSARAARALRTACADFGAPIGPASVIISEQALSCRSRPAARPFMPGISCAGPCSPAAPKIPFHR